MSQKECEERFGCTQSGNCEHCGKLLLTDFEKHISFCHLGARVDMLLPGYVVPNVEVDYSGLSLPLLADQSDRMPI